jgi:cytidine deaminase
MATPIAPHLVEAMLAAARDAQKHAHAPYSRFRVGAAVLDEHDRIHAGCNVENAAYPLGNCAEAVAIGALVTQGGKRIRAIAIVGDGESLVPPCGACRQRLRELAADDIPILVGDRERLRATFTLGQLLPHSFGPENLKP